LLGIDEDLPR